MIIAILATLQLGFAALLLVLSIWLSAEVLASFGLKPHESQNPEPGPIAVVIPAHNEGNGLIPTIKDVQAQLRPQDRLIIVADNCEDDTADVARAEGAEVLVRQDPARRGKGYALQFGLDHLRENPPAVVLFTDADCLHSDGLVQHVCAQAAALGDPAQALYMMHAEENAPPSRSVASFAWLLINDVRMRGLARLAGATRLVGAGAAFPWAVAENLALGSGEIVEDLALTITLAAEGQRVRFAPEYVVSSTFPESEDAARVQRARWEHGSVGIIRQRIGRLIRGSLVPPQFWRLALALNVLVPPLSLFAVLLFAGVVSGTLLAVLGAWTGLLIAALAAALFTLAIGVAWLGRGRGVLPVSELSALVSFLAFKIGVYGKSARESSRQWTRTPRDGEQS
ncbi:MAG: glycosyltransferase [Pseudomonadota bacterium]